MHLKIKSAKFRPGLLHVLGEVDSLFRCYCSSSYSGNTIWKKGLRVVSKSSNFAVSE